MRYNTYTYNPSSTTYFSGLIKPWQDYIIFTTSNSDTYAVIGNAVSYENNIIKFENSKVIHINRSVNLNTYTVTENNETNTEVNVTNPYYTYSNSIQLSPNINLTSSNNITCYFVS